MFTFHNIVLLSERFLKQVQSAQTAAALHANHPSAALIDFRSLSVCCVCVLAPVRTESCCQIYVGQFWGLNVNKHESNSAAAARPLYCCFYSTFIHVPLLIYAGLLNCLLTGVLLSFIQSWARVKSVFVIFKTSCHHRDWWQLRREARDWSEIWRCFFVPLSALMFQVYVAF